MNTRLTSSVAAGAVAAALALAGCGGSNSGSTSGGSPAAGGGALTKVKVAYIPITAAGALKVGIDQGYFKEQGLELELQQVANPPAGIAAVAGGQVQFNYSPSIPVVNATANGVKLKVVAAADGYADGIAAAVAKDPSEGLKHDDTAVVVPQGSGITRARELEGKTVAIPARKAQLEVTIADAVKKDGGNPAAIKWITLDFPSAVSSLKSKRVDAAGLVPPFVGQGTAAGGKVLFSPGISFFGDGAVGLWVTSGAYATSDAKTVTAFQKAIVKTNAYADTHILEVQQAAAALLKTDLKVIQDGGEPYFPAAVTTANLDNAVTKMVELGYLAKPIDSASLLFTSP